MPAPAYQGSVWGAAARYAMGGFFLSGLLMAFLGAMLPAWGFHVQSNYTRIGFYFLSFNAGLILSAPLAQYLLGRKGLRFLITLACILAASSILYLAVVTPPARHLLRIAGLFVLGASAGILNLASFTAMSPVYRRDPAAAVNLGGLMFTFGSLIAALLVSGTFYIYTTGAILILMAVLPSYLAIFYARSKWKSEPAPPHVPLKQAVSEFRNLAAILFAMLLFFQFGNEWVIAGWLPLFLTQRLGVSPANSLLLLALYWLALLVGRILMQAVLLRTGHGKVLMGSVISAMMGCFILSFTDNVFGAGTALLMTGGGFAAIYPLVVERIGSRFPAYHPGLFNGLFSIAVTGGMLASASVGFWAELFGVRVAMWLPLAGSIAVFVLSVLIWLEAKLTQV